MAEYLLFIAKSDPLKNQSNESELFIKKDDIVRHPCSLFLFFFYTTFNMAITGSWWRWSTVLSFHQSRQRQ
jgi:hypothetical protein